MSVSHKSLSELNELLSALCDGPFEAAQFQRIEQLVREDAELRWYYIRYLHMHSSLARYVRVELDDAPLLSMEPEAGALGIEAVTAGHSTDRTSAKVAADNGLVGRQHGRGRQLGRFALAAMILVAGLVLIDQFSMNSRSGKAFAAALRQLTTAKVICYTAEFKHRDVVERISESMHLQPDRVREELPDGKIKVIDFSKRRNITLDPVHRTAVVVSDAITNESPKLKPERFLDKIKEAIERIRTDPLRTDRYLGMQIVDGRKREGFQMRKPSQMQTIWMDVDTGLLAEMEIVSTDGSGRSITARNFQFDVESYESLFSVEPPPGYAVSYETVGPAKPLDEQAKMIPR
jgi:outer membrane lipoprotein-sorting protein